MHWALLACLLGWDPCVIERPIDFPDERVRLTIEYRRIHQDPAADGVTIDPRVIVLHYTESPTAQGTMRYFDKTKLEGRKEIARAGLLNVSSHFVIDRDGTIFRLMPETTMARHTIGLNHLAIGVENVGGGSKWPLTAAQVTANVRLVRWLKRRFPAITHVIGHSEADALAKAGHPYWLERDKTYKNGASDPGRDFLQAVRAELGDELKLQ